MDDEMHGLAGKIAKVLVVGHELAGVMPGHFPVGPVAARPEGISRDVERAVVDIVRPFPGPSSETMPW